MEPRRKSGAGKRTSGVKETDPEKTVSALSLPNIAKLIAYGEITVGQHYHIGCIAIANDEHNSLAMLKRRKGETLVQLLTRLDQAIHKAWAEDTFTDEINTQP
jgi:hypothetical protein